MRSKNTDYMNVLIQTIDEYQERYDGLTPTRERLAALTNVSIATVSRYLNYLQQEGKIELDGHRNIITPQGKAVRQDTNIVPVVGAIACGPAKFAEQHVDEYLRLPVSMTGKGEFFLLRADGDSMINIGVNIGDLVLIRKQNQAETGQIIVALVEGESATLKRYYPEPENHRIRLHPENDELKDMYYEDVQIQGVAVKVIKDLV